LDGDSQTIPGWQNRVFATIIRPIIPQRFEIMTVQAAFSPLRLPRIKDLFRRGNSEGLSQEAKEDSMPRTSSIPYDEGSTWIPLLEPRYKTQPPPRILKFPESETMTHENNIEKTTQQQMDDREFVFSEVDLPTVELNSTTTGPSDDRNDTAPNVSDSQVEVDSSSGTTGLNESEFLFPKQMDAAPIEVDVGVIHKVESTQESKNPMQLNGNTSNGAKVIPHQDPTNEGIKTQETSKFWSDDGDTPFSLKFWSDHTDAPFSPTLLSMGELIETFRLKRASITTILPLFGSVERYESTWICGEAKYVDSLRVSSAMLEASTGIRASTLRSLLFKRPFRGMLNLRPLKFCIPLTLLVSLSLGGSITRSPQYRKAQHLLNTKGMMSPSISIAPFQYRNSANTSSKPQISNESSASQAPEEDRCRNVNFVAPLLDYGYPPAANELSSQQNPARESYKDENKPILVYLPGFDGTYICPFLQFPELGTEFEVWCMTVGMSDRSTYEELKAMVMDFIDHLFNGDGDDADGSEVGRSKSTSKHLKALNKTTDMNKVSARTFWGFLGGSSSFSATVERRQKANGRPIYLAGESFGGILAADIGLTLLGGKQKCKNTPIVNLQGLVLINPATCYDRSQLAIKGPQVSNMPNALYVIGLFGQLMPLFTDEYSVEQLGLILQSKALPSVIDNPLREAYMGRVAISLPTKLEFMPPDTLSWRLEQWLQTGCATMRESSFKSFPNFRTLIVVGENDKALPSIAEAERLANKVMLPSQTQIHVVEGAGHASTCGSRLDLAAVMRKHFSELQKSPRMNSLQQPKNDADVWSTEIEKRTSMKPAAKEGSGPRFGMVERYDKARIGLNPILYWSKSNYRSVQSTVVERRIFVPESKCAVSYKKTKYMVPP
jgi:hypothetical protein